MNRLESERHSATSSGGKKEAINVIFTDPQVLHCRICRKPLYVPVYQCENGHISCCSCCTKVQNKCPSCGPEKGFIRCIAIEKVLESIKIPCKNLIYGCNETMNLNQINNHESLCAHKSCLCPLPDCSYVGSVKQLSSHFREKHKVLVKNFSYNSRFTICVNIDESYCIFQAENDGVLFFLSYSFEIFGIAVTMSQIGSSSSERKLCYEIRVKMQGCVLSLQSVANEIQGRSKVPPSNKSLLILNEYFRSSLKILDFRIWPGINTGAHTF